MSEWKEYTLGDMADIQTGPFGSQLHASDYVDVGIPSIMPTNIGTRLEISRTNITCIKESDAIRLERYRVKNEDIVYSRRGDVEKCAFVTEKENGWLCGTGCLRVRFISSKILPKFCAYYLSTDDIKSWVSNNAVGTTMPNLNSGILKRLPLFIPSLPEQKVITATLSSIDDKIDLLHRQNATLEAMAETLFRQWFVEEAKEDWVLYSLNELVDSANTGLDAIRRAPIVEEDTGIKCLRIQDISQDKPFQNWGNSKVTDNDFEKARLRTGDLIMARTCSPGIIYYARQDLKAVFNNGLARIRPNKNLTYSIFLYYLFKTDDFIGHIYGISDGTSVQLNMKLGDLLSYKIQFPPKYKQDEYYPIFQSLDDKILKIKTQIRTLTTLRDTLLPKLMSGEVRVKM